MSYQVLARKYRPQVFRDLAGQEHVLQALVSALDRDRLHHAYLFTGTRGVGKTTIARILARCLNCETGVSSEPCGTCSACTEITEGRFVDLIEVDAASRTKVEDTRELLENVQYAPVRGRYKVYLIDEVHMLSNHSFNALLKTLEEPPPHVKFLLATTDPQKLPATVLSRCLQFNLKNLTAERIVQHLQLVLEQELITFEQPALWQLARAAQGSMRDALSLTDQAIAFGSGKVLDAQVGTMLGAVDRGAVTRLLQHLVAADGAAVFAEVAHLAEFGADYQGVLEALISLLHNVALAQVVPQGLDSSLADAEAVIALAAEVSAEEIQLYYQMAINGRRDMPWAPDPRAALEMVLLRMLAFKPLAVPDWEGATVAQPAATGSEVPAAKKPEGGSNTGAAAGLAAPPPQAEATGASAAHRAPPVADVAAPLMQASQPSTEQLGANEAEPAQTAPVQEEAVSAAPLQAAPLQAAPMQAAPLQAAPLQAAPEQEAAPQQVDANNTAVASHSAEQAGPLPELNPANWAQVFSRLPLSGIVQSIASNCELQRIEGNTWYMVLDQQHGSLYSDSYGQRLGQALGDIIGQRLQLVMSVGQVSVETPAARRQRLQQEALQRAIVVLQQDPNVQLLRDQFGGELDLSSVTPRKHREVDNV